MKKAAINEIKIIVQNSENCISDQPPSSNQEMQSSDSQNLLGSSKADEVIKKERKKGDEVNGPRGLEPTRYGDWESKGRCIDF